MPNVIELIDVTKIYNKDTKYEFKALENINLSFAEGSFNAIIGQSGSGKSTLLNIIGTLDSLTSGKVLINGIDVSKYSKNQLSDIRNKYIGFIFQFHYLLPEFTVLENVLMPYQIGHKKASQETKNYALELLEIVGLKDVVNNNANKLSGGQQQRVAIARSLMNHPKVILADEPTGNLDSRTTEQIYELFRTINKKFNTTFIIITHNEDIAKKADRAIEVKDGMIK